MRYRKNRKRELLNFKILMFIPAIIFMFGLAFCLTTLFKWLGGFCCSTFFDWMTVLSFLISIPLTVLVFAWINLKFMEKE